MIIILVLLIPVAFFFGYLFGRKHGIEMTELDMDTTMVRGFNANGEVVTKEMWQRARRGGPIEPKPDINPPPQRPRSRTTVHQRDSANYSDNPAPQQGQLPRYPNARQDLPARLPSPHDWNTRK